MTDIAALKKTVEQEIRSSLMFDADGLSISDFVRNYRDTIGRDVPFHKFGYSSLTAYLQSIKHVVQFLYKNSQPFIVCVPDEKTEHTFRMAQVTKRNKTKKRGSRFRSSYSSNYSNNNSSNYSNNNSSNYSNNNGANYSNNYSSNYSNNYSNRYRENEQKLKHEAIHNFSQKKCVPDESQKNITSILNDVGIHGISIDLFQSLFNQHHGINLNYVYFGFTSLQSCLESVPEIATLKKKDNDRMFCYSTPVLRQQQQRQQGAIPKMSQSAVRFAPEPSPRTEAQKISSSSNENEFTDEYSEEEDEDMNDIIKKRMREVLQNNPNGIWIDDFLDKYEKLHGDPLDLDGIGYNNITELVDQFPTIFGITHRLKPCNKDLIYDPANPPAILKTSPTKTGDKTIPQDVIENIQTILEANTDDLSITTFENLYKMNCGEDLPLLLHGFISLEEFLVELMLYIPFVMTEVRGVKFLKFKSSVKTENAVAVVARHELTPSPTRLSSVEATPLWNLNVPRDAATCSDTYRQQTFPVENAFFNVQVAEVVNPGDFWIQMVGLQFTEALDTLMNRLEEFYESDVSENYQIPHVQVSLNLPCAALYAKDWHRALITALPHEGVIEVFYVDYGTKKVIPRNTARFLKKEFLELPKQAIKARLALIEPPTELDWSLESGRKLLQLTTGKKLLCQVIDAFYPCKSISVFLSETRTHEKDLHVNEILISEGYAKESNDEKQELLYRARDEEIRSLEEQRLYDAIGYKPYMDIPSPSPSITRSNSILSDYPSRSCAMSYIVPPVGPQYEMRNISPPVTLSPVSAPIPPPISNLVPPPSESTIKSPPGGFTKGLTYGGLDLEIIERLYRKKKELETSSATSVESTQQQLIDSRSPPKSIFTSSWVYDMSVFETLNSPSSVSPPVSSSQPTLSSYATSVSQPNINPPTSLDINTIPKTVAYVPTVARDSSTSPILIDGNERMSPSNGLQQAKYVKKLSLADKYHGHLINYKSKLCLTSADLSKFIYASSSINLEKQFKRMKITLETLIVDKTECLPLFMELQRKGVKELPSFITLYPLESCIKALNLIDFKNPKLKEELTTTLNNFNPNDPYWNETDNSDEECEDLDTINEEIKELCEKREQVLKQMLNKGELDIFHYNRIYIDITDEIIDRIILRSTILRKSTTDHSSQVLRNLTTKGASQPQKSVQAVAPLVSRVITTNNQVQPTTAPVSVQSMLSQVPNVPPQASVVGPQFWMGYPPFPNFPVLQYSMFQQPLSRQIQVPFPQYTQIPYMNPNNK